MHPIAILNRPSRVFLLWFALFVGYGAMMWMSIDGGEPQCIDGGEVSRVELLR